MRVYHICLLLIIVFCTNLLADVIVVTSSEQDNAVAVDNSDKGNDVTESVTPPETATDANPRVASTAEESKEFISAVVTTLETTAEGNFIAPSTETISGPANSQIHQQYELEAPIVAPVIAIAESITETAPAEITNSNVGSLPSDIVLEPEEEAERLAEINAMKEILELQATEEAERLQLEQEALSDAAIAEEAERIAKEKERDQLRKERAEAVAAAAAAAETQKQRSHSESSHEFTKRSTLKQATTGAAQAAAGLEQEKRRDNSIPDGASRSGSGYFNSHQQANQQQHAGVNTPRMGAGSGPGGMSRSQSAFGSLEMKLDAAMREQGQGMAHTTAQDRAAVRALLVRWQVGRSLARPVERVLTSARDPRTSLYDVLEVSPQADDSSIKRAYRHIALLVHPDKNPHADAKLAFDAVQDAFETLSSLLQRAAYDKKLQKSRNWSVKKLKKKVNNAWINWTARWQLFLARCRRGELSEEVAELKLPLLQLGNTLRLGVVKLAYQPSVVDRLQLFHEFLWDHSKALTMGLCAVTGLSALFRPLQYS